MRGTSSGALGRCAGASTACLARWPGTHATALCLQIDPLSLRMLKPYQKVNKFPKASALTLKANLWSNFYRMQQKFGAEAFDHMPPTCILPNQLELLEARGRHMRA